MSDPVSLNFERSALKSTRTWSGLGWRAEGDAFQLGPRCARHGAEEGSCYASSELKAQGRLSAELVLPPYGHVSLLARGRARHRGLKVRGHLELRLQRVNSPHTTIRLRVSTDGRWRRYHLAPRTLERELKQALKVRVSLIDASLEAELSVDDLKLDTALDAPDTR